MKTIEHWIDGGPTAAASTRRAPVYDPATGRQQAAVLLAESADVDTAVAAATKAYGSWGESSLAQRMRVMFAFRELLLRNEDELAAIVAAEHGKTVADARGEIVRGREVVECACGIADALQGGYFDQYSRGVDVLSFREPLGVVAGITPFNFPAMAPMWMHPIAIATGNTFLLKPSERDPSASDLIARLYTEAGLPDGVFNVVHGDRTAVDAILDHPGIAAVSFVGSTPVAKYVAVGDAAKPLVEVLARKVRAIRVGPGQDPVSEMGPLITWPAQERVTAAVVSAAAQGATVVVDGRGLQVPGYEEGFFLPMSRYSFGGWKDSLFGDSSIHGPEGVRFYTRPKVVTTRWPDSVPSSPAAFAFPTSH